MTMSRAPRAFSYRDDASVPAFADDQPIVIFDSVCVLCSRFAQFLLRRDRSRRIRLPSAQSPLGGALYVHYGLDPVNFTTNMLIANGVASFKSDAFLNIMSLLSLPWSLARVGRCIPRVIRDRMYDVIARNRLRWFGMHAVCYVPSAADRERLLE